MQSCKQISEGTMTTETRTEQNILMIMTICMYVRILLVNKKGRKMWRFYPWIQPPKSYHHPKFLIHLHIVPTILLATYQTTSLVYLRRVGFNITAETLTSLLGSSINLQFPHGKRVCMSYIESWASSHGKYGEWYMVFVYRIVTLVINQRYWRGTNVTLIVEHECLLTFSIFLGLEVLIRRTNAHAVHILV